MRNKLILLILGLSLIILISGCNQEAGANPDDNIFQGTIESEDIDINTKVPGRIAEILIEEGEEVREGDTIAIIDVKDLNAKREGLSAQAKAAAAGVMAAEAQYQASLGQLATVEATLKKAINGTRNQDVIKATVNYDIMKKNYERIKSLYEEGAVPLAQLDEIETKMNIAYQELNMAQEGAREEDIEAARAQVQSVKGVVAAAQSSVAASKEKHQQALAGVREVDVYIQDAVIKAPLGGTVSMINSSKGDLISTGMNIATITNLENTWVTIQVEETELAKFTEGQEVGVRVAAYDNEKLIGKITRINEKADYAVKRASNENGEFDLIAYGIKVKIDNSQKLLRPGMTAFIELNGASEVMTDHEK